MPTSRTHVSRHCNTLLDYDSNQVLDRIILILIENPNTQPGTNTNTNLTEITEEVFIRGISGLRNDRRTEQVRDGLIRRTEQVSTC